MERQETKTFLELQKVPLQTSIPSAVTVAGPDLDPGVVVGRYLVLHRVGAGGMGTVYAAYDPELDRKVAVKLLHRGLEPIREQQRTRREAKAMARLAHPNVVTVYDVGVYKERAFIAMEYVEGHSMRDWLAAEERPWRQAVAAFIEAGRGLAAAHQAGLVHLDFKPGNVMMTPDGRVRVLDFGLARFETAELAAGPAEPEGPLADSSRIAGTPAYLAPERVLGRPGDARSDQFSFCVAAWTALYGEHPFGGSGVDEYLDRVTRGEIRETVPTATAPSWLRKVLRRGLSPGPEERYPSMDDLLRALAPGLRQPRPRWVAAVGAGAALAALAIGYLGARSDRPPICGGAEVKAAQVWNDAKKGIIRRAFLDTGLPYAAEVFAAVESALDSYTDDWSAMHAETCEATRVHGEQSDRMLDLRMVCLDGRLEEVRALIEVLKDADTEVVVRSLAGTKKLGDLRRCAERAELTHLTLPSPDALSREKVERIRARVEEQYALDRVARPVDLAVLEHSAADARQVGFAPLEARALALLAEEKLFAAGDTASAEDNLERALKVAIAAGDRPLQARLYSLLVRTLGYFQGRHEEIRLWKGFAEATLAAIGPGHEGTEVRVYNDLAVHAWSSGEHGEAEAQARRAVETGERIWGPDDPRLASPLNNLANPILGQAGRTGEAIRHLERALALAETYGQWNPRYMGPSLTNLANAYVIDGRFDSALAATLRCLRTLEDFVGEHRDLVYPLLNLAYLLSYHFDRPGEAEAHLVRALPLVRSGFGDRHPLLVELYTTLADAKLRQLRFDQAEAAIEQARELLNGRFQPETRLNQGRLLLARGRFVEARRDLERALSKLEDDPPLHDRAYAGLLVALGETHLSLRQPERAQPYLEKVLDEGRGDHFPELGAEARFALARSLAPGESEKVVELSRRALATLSGESPMSRQRRARLERWLGAHAITDRGR